VIAPEAIADREAAIFAANTFRRIFVFMVGLLIAAMPLLWLRYGRGMALSFVLGGAISLINFYWLKRVLAAMVEAVAVQGKRRSAAGIVLRFVLRYVLI
jgi:hypothetical protein